MREFFHILNPSRCHRRGVRKFFHKNADLSYQWVERTSHPTHLETVVQWAFNEGRPKIAVWGGDGTLSRVVQTLYELNALEKMTVALIPVGTCNDFARKLALPKWRKYAQTALSAAGFDRHFDIGILATSHGKRAFINNAGFGRTRHAVTGQRRSHPLEDIFAFTTKRLDLEWECGGTRHYETRAGLLGVVCNGPFFNNGMYFEKNIEPDDTLLNAFVEEPQPRYRLLLKFLKSRLGSPLSDPKTFRIDARILRVESDGDLFPQVDGEPVGTTAERVIEFSVLPNKLHFVLFR